MPSNDPPDVSLKKAMRALTQAQRYLNRAGCTDLGEDIIEIKEAVSSKIGAMIVEGRCLPCLAGEHYKCLGDRLGAICVCTAISHFPRTGVVS